MRHAKAEREPADLDRHRRLAERGMRDGVAAGRLLAEHDLDVVLCSSATRTRQTWERAQLGGAVCDDVRLLDELYLATTGTLIRAVQALDDAAATALVVGHEPTLSSAVLSLARRGDGDDEAASRVAQAFPTSSIAVLEFDGPWAELRRGGATLTRFEVARA